MDAVEGLQMFLPPVDKILPDCVRHQAVSGHEEGDEARRPPPPGDDGRTPLRPGRAALTVSDCC